MNQRTGEKYQRNRKREFEWRDAKQPFQQVHANLSVVAGSFVRTGKFYLLDELKTDGHRSFAS